MKQVKTGKCSQQNRELLLRIITLILKGIIYDEYRAFSIKSTKKSIQIKLDR